LKGAGISSVEALADMTPEQLEAIEGIGPKTVEKISVAVNNYFAALEGGEAMALPENEGEPVSEIPAEGAAAEENSVEAAPESEAGEEELSATAEGSESEPGVQESEQIEGEQSPEPAEQKE
jgi:N utilization substance protein A